MHKAWISLMLLLIATSRVLAQEPSEEPRVQFGVGVITAYPLSALVGVRAQLSSQIALEGFGLAPIPGSGAQISFGLVGSYVFVVDSPVRPHIFISSTLVRLDSGQIGPTIGVGVGWSFSDATTHSRTYIRLGLGTTPLFFTNLGIAPGVSIVAGIFFYL